MDQLKPRSLDNQLCFSLYAASIAMSRVYKPMLDKVGITYPQYLVLHALWDADDRTIGALADRLALESSTITPLVKRLEAAGFVTRARDPDDERHVRVRLTEKDDALRGESACIGEAVLERTGLSLDQAMGLTGQMHDLRASLSKPLASAAE